MTILVALFVLAVLIFVHELGHFLVAKACGVGVLEFAIGFWKKIFSFKHKETNYCLRLVPLGGFVRMAGDDPRLLHDPELVKNYMEGSTDGSEPSAESKLTGDALAGMSPAQLAVMRDPSKWFLNKGYWQKMAIVFAGPAFNVIFALVASIGALWVWGMSVPAPIIGEVVEGLPAQVAGLQAGDRVIAINDSAVVSWFDLAGAITRSEGQELTIKVQRPNLAELPGVLEGSDWGQVWEVGEVSSSAIDLKTAAQLQELTFTLKGVPASQAESGAGAVPAKITLPDGTTITPMVIGVKNADLKLSVSFLEALDKGSKRTWAIFAGTVAGLYQMAVGDIPADSIRGPIFIFDTAAKTAEAGFEYLLNFMIFLSMSLAILNLLPIPILDGGHLLFFTIEAIKGSPISLRVREFSYQVGMVMLMLLMAFAIGNDIVDLFK